MGNKSLDRHPVILLGAEWSAIVGQATRVSDMEPRIFEGVHVRKSASNVQKLKEEFGAEEKAKGRGVPVVHTSPADRGVTIVALVSHFGV